MALKDEDFLLKNDKDLEAAMAKLGLVLNEEKEGIRRSYRPIRL